MSKDYTEDTLVEQPAIALFREMGWETANLYGEWTRHHVQRRPG